MSRERSRVVRFGVFEADLVAHELRRRGARIKIQDLPFRVLALLLERPGEVVTREELQEAIWPDVEYGLFDLNLNTAIAKIRQALDDSAAQPQWVETVPRVGYRWIGEVTAVRRVSAKRAIALAGAVAAVIVAVLALWPYEEGPARAEVAINLPATSPELRPVTSFGGDETEPSFSPDGRSFVFVWSGGESRVHNLYIQSLDGGAPVRLTSSSDWEWSPEFSPDGKRVAFFRRRSHMAHELRIISVEGGAEQHVLDIEAEGAGLGMSWHPDGGRLAIVARQQADEANRVYILDLVTRVLTPASSRRPQGLGEAFPIWSPDGSRLAFVRADPSEGKRIVIATDGAEQTFAADTFGGLVWTPDGTRLLFPSPSGELGGELWDLNPATGVTRSRGFPGVLGFHPSLSRQGDKLLYASRRSDRNLWLQRISGEGIVSSPEPLVYSSFNDDSPTFLEGGERLAFASNRSGTYEIWVSDAHGLAERQLTTFGKGNAGSPAWSPDSRWIAFDYRNERAGDIWIVPATGGSPTKFTDYPGEDFIPCWSHDSSAIYFASDRGGDNQIWRKPLHGGDAVQITRAGGFECREHRPSGGLYFTRSDSDEKLGIWRHDLDTGSEQPIAALSRVGVERYWTVAGDGLYFKNFRGRAASERTNSELFRYDLHTHEVTSAARIPGLVYSGPSGLAVSPDESEIAFGQSDYRNTDIFLVTGLTP